MGLKFVNEDQIRSRYSYNLYEFAFESIFSDVPGEILVETNFFTTAYPSEIVTIHNL